MHLLLVIFMLHICLCWIYGEKTKNITYNLLRVKYSNDRFCLYFVCTSLCRNVCYLVPMDEGGVRSYVDSGNQTLVLCKSSSWLLIQFSFSIALATFKNFVLQSNLDLISFFKRVDMNWAVDVHTFNSSCWEAEAGRSVWVWDHPGL